MNYCSLSSLPEQYYHDTVSAQEFAHVCPVLQRAPPQAKVSCHQYCDPGEVNDYILTSDNKMRACAGKMGIV